jgi:hypothetical protein
MLAMRYATKLSTLPSNWSLYSTGSYYNSLARRVEANRVFRFGIFMGAIKNEWSGEVGGSLAREGRTLLLHLSPLKNTDQGWGWTCIL